MSAPAVSAGLIAHICTFDVGHAELHPEMGEHQPLWWHLAGNSNGGTFGGANSILAASASVAMVDGVRVSQKERWRKTVYA